MYIAVLLTLARWYMYDQFVEVIVRWLRTHVNTHLHKVMLLFHCKGQLAMRVIQLK